MPPTLTSLCFYVLLPIVPAFLLFLSLPKLSSSSGEVQGTFQGMQIKLGGSFAGYFIVLLAIFIYFPVKAAAPFREFNVWGRLLNADGTPDKTLNPLEISSEPPQLTFTPDGTFSMHIIVPQGADLPILRFSRSGTALQQNIPLATKVKSDSSSGVGTQSIELGDIKLTDTPQLTDLPAYNETPSQVTSITPVH
jgi:hypothetical protein